jgi:hypothetical protein
MAREKRKVSAIKTVRIKDFYSFKFKFYDSFFLILPNRALIKHFLLCFSFTFVGQTCRNPYQCLKGLSQVVDLAFDDMYD